MTGFTLLYTPRAVKDIRSLDRVVQKRLAGRLLDLQKDPLGLSKKLISSGLGTHRYRVGDYRVIFDLKGHDIIVLRVGHRREIYR